jgi:hypothetical protein
MDRSGDNKREVLRNQSRQFLINTADYYFRRENGGPLYSAFVVHQRTADTFQVSLRTVGRILSSNGLLSPRCKRFAPKSYDIPSVVLEEIRNVIYDMYLNKEHVTLESLHRKVTIEKQIYEIGKTYNATKKIGFRYKKTDNRRGLCPQSHIVAKRISFLRSCIKNLRSDKPWVFAYTDETWVFSKASEKPTWQDGLSKSLHKGKSSTKEGFIDGGSLTFSTKNKSADYYDNMNAELYEKWFEEKLLLGLTEPTTVNCNCLR